MKITLEYPSGVEQNGWETWTTQNEKSDKPTRSCLQIEVWKIRLNHSDY